MSSQTMRHATKLELVRAALHVASNEFADPTGTYFDAQAELDDDILTDAITKYVQARDAEVFAVRFSNVEPPEIDSLWWVEEDADKRAAEKNKRTTARWVVEKVTVSASTR